MQMTNVRTSPALDGVELIAVRVRILVSPSSHVLERDRIDNERVAIPASHLFAEKRRIRVVAVLAAVGRNQAIGRVPVEKSNLVGAFEQLKRQRAGVVARYATYDA